MLEQFADLNFRKDSLGRIEQANAIIREYQDQGFRLTLRQLYYQFVARGLIENSIREYKKLGALISNGRIAGLIDWEAIEDRLRTVNTTSTWDDPQDILRSAATSYKENPWDSQALRVEVWIEKDALIGVIEPACERWRVPYFACRGYASQSSQYEAGKRILRDAETFNRQTLILHLGDHDPSGLDMTRDIADRLRMFSANGHGSIVDVKRIALNFDQVERYQPPPNPTKDTDTRSGTYRDAFGEDCWELDALDPTVIDELIEREIASVADSDAWDSAMSEESSHRNLLSRIHERFDEIERFLDESAPPSGGGAP
jgi:hypothetical protein